MLIGGLQKTSLLDYPDKISSVIFTCGCNFRCSYCHNPHLVEKAEAKIDEKELLETLERRKNYIDAVVVTGGEPTIQKDIKDFLKKIKDMAFLIKLDTNGAEPEILEDLLKNKLIDYVAMDIKAPLDLYKDITNTDIDAEKIKRSIELVMNSGLDYEFRTTAYPKLSIDDFRKILQLIKGAKRYFIQQFEPGNVLKDERLEPHEREKLYEILDIAKDFVDEVGVRNVE